MRTAATEYVLAFRFRDAARLATVVQTMTDYSELAVSEARQSGVVVPDSIEHVKGVEGIDILFLCIWGGGFGSREYGFNSEVMGHRPS